MPLKKLRARGLPSLMSSRGVVSELKACEPFLGEAGARVNDFSDKDHLAILLVVPIVVALDDIGRHEYPLGPKPLLLALLLGQKPVRDRIPVPVRRLLSANPRPLRPPPLHAQGDLELALLHALMPGGVAHRLRPGGEALLHLLRPPRLAELPMVDHLDVAVTVLYHRVTQPRGLLVGQHQRRLYLLHELHADCRGELSDVDLVPRNLYAPVCVVPNVHRVEGRFRKLLAGPFVASSYRRHCPKDRR
mmetsp:Transcript_28139/g.68917  ORF Transcript_28139/g.68917 Transcript_28139/m.68917 type:complete len:247 (+) Transcript_28139:94-834(+)